LNLIIDGNQIPEHRFFILIKNYNFKLDVTYLTFIHQNKLYGAVVGGQTYSVNSKLTEKYNGFNGTDDHFLALDKKNFILPAEELNEITYQKKFQRNGAPFAGALDLTLPSAKKERYIIHTENNVPALLLQLKNHFSTQLTLKDGKRIIPIEEYTPFAMDQQTAAGTIPCSNCNTETDIISTTHFPPSNKKEVDLFLCSDCFQIYEQELQQETKDIQIPQAITWGFAAAIIGSLLWYIIVVLTEYQLGIAAIAIGWIVATAVIRGSGNKRGPVVQKISVGITFFSMMLSEYLIIRHFLVLSLAEEGTYGIPYLLPIATMAELIVLGIQLDPLTLGFWGFAMYQAYIIPARRSAISKNRQALKIPAN
jgi:hypothetical protein